MDNFTAIVLAAGKGERMKSSLPKVLHTLEDKPLLWHVLTQLKQVKQIQQILVVTGYQAAKVEAYVKENAGAQKSRKIEFCRQKKLLGTGDAVRCALSKVKYDNVLVLCGDAPLITADTLQSFLVFHQQQASFCSLISASMPADNDLGKIIRDPLGNVQAIREKVDLDTLVTHRRDSLKEVNSGIYAFDKDKLQQNLAKIQKNPKKDEYFLTDLIEIFYDQAANIAAYALKDSNEIYGINTKRDLINAAKIMRQRTIYSLIEQGVTIIDPDSTYIASGTQIGQNTVIFPFTFIEKNVIIGSSCSLGPFLHLREGTILEDNSQLGNFVEVVRSTIGKDVRAKHHAYIGDTTIAGSVNVGAGTIIANYDGKHKNKTVIEKGAFIGSNSVLIAPVRIGANAITGAGSVVTKNVPARTTVVGVPAKVFIKKRKKI